MARDEGAIRWLIDTLTEEAEIDLPGSFNTEWGMEVWRKVSEGVEDEDKITNATEMNITILSSRTMTGRNHPTLHPPDTPPPSVPTKSSQGEPENAMRELCRRVAHLLETCKNRSLFGSDEQWRKRIRACIEATASLVCFTNAELGWFEDAGRLLGDIGKV